MFDLVWPHLAGGCHCSRDTEAAIKAAGFAIEESDRFHFRPMPFVFPTVPHLLGAARRV